MGVARVAPGTDVAMPSTPALAKPWMSAICSSGVPPAGPWTSRFDAQVRGRELGGLDDLLDEGIAQDVGHEADVDRLHLLVLCMDGRAADGAQAQCHRRAQRYDA